MLVLSSSGFYETASRNNVDRWMAIFPLQLSCKFYVTPGLVSNIFDGMMWTYSALPQNFSSSTVSTVTLLLKGTILQQWAHAAYWRFQSRGSAFLIDHLSPITPSSPMSVFSCPNCLTCAQSRSWPPFLLIPGFKHTFYTIASARTGLNSHN